MSQIVPPWLPIALGELGTVEMPGAANNSRILEYHKATSLQASQDAVPWCSSFTNWVLREAGITGTNSAAARSFASWGKAVRPCLGAIVVMSRGANPAHGHVGFFLDARDGVLFLLGGNQNDRVSIAQYGASRVLGYRWPAVAHPSPDDPPN